MKIKRILIQFFFTFSIFDISGQSSCGSHWEQEAYIKAVNNDAGDNFGKSVSLSLNTLVVGASSESSSQTTITNGTTTPTDDLSSGSGAVYLYTKSSGLWAQEAYIKASNNSAGDFFGSSVSLDGDTLAVGAPSEDSVQSTITNGSTASADDTRTDSGAAYVYRKSSGLWAQEAYIKASNNSAGDQFGKNVSLDGDTLAVGANEEDSGQTTIISGTTAAIDDTKTNSGAVYIYKRDGVSWEQEAYIKSSNSDLDDNFGEVFSLDGDSIAVGVYLEDSNQTTITNGTTAASTDNSNTDSGAVYVFTRTFK